jgi:hypothetical protein
VSEIKHRTVETNGIHMHIAESGTGPLVVLCHGFPESWYSWRHQLHALAEAGFHAMRQICKATGRRIAQNNSIGTRCSILLATWSACSHRDSGDRRTRLGRPRRVVRSAFAARSLSQRDRFERAVHTATTRSSYQHYAPERGRAVLSAVLPIPRHSRGGARARCPCAHSQLPLLGFRGRPG